MNVWTIFTILLFYTSWQIPQSQRELQPNRHTSSAISAYKSITKLSAGIRSAFGDSSSNPASALNNAISGGMGAIAANTPITENHQASQINQQQHQHQPQQLLSTPLGQRVETNPVGLFCISPVGKTVSSTLYLFSVVKLIFNFLRSLQRSMNSKPSAVAQVNL